MMILKIVSLTALVVLQFLDKKINFYYVKGLVVCATLVHAGVNIRILLWL